MTAEQKATKAKHTEHIRLTAQKVKALPEWAQQRIQGYADGVADATKKKGGQKAPDDTMGEGGSYHAKTTRKTPRPDDGQRLYYAAARSEDRAWEIRHE